MILLVMVVFSALSLFSYSWTDISILKARASQPPDNLIGPVGAWMSFLLFMTFGVGAYLTPLWFLIVGFGSAADSVLRYGRGAGICNVVTVPMP